MASLNQKNVLDSPEATVQVETLGLHVPVPEPKQSKLITSSVSASNVFRHPETHPVVLDLILLRKYGPDFLMWEIETLHMRIPKDFGVDSVSELNLNKIGALKTLHLVDTFLQRWEVFNWCTSAFNGNFPNFEVMQVPTVAQCMISIDIANRLRNDVDWSSEVKAFIQSVYTFEGILLTIPPVNFVDLDVSDYVVDITKLKNMWDSFRTSKQVPDGDTVEHEQLRRLLFSQEQLAYSKGLLKSQLKVVQDVRY